MTEFEEQLQNMTAETIGRDLLAALVDECKALPDCWQRLGQGQQDDVIYRLEKRVHQAVARAVGVLAAQDRTFVVATIESVTIKDGTKATLVINPANRQEARQDLFDSVRSACLIVLADPEDHTHGTDEVKGAPDQPGLPGFGDGGDGDDPLYVEALAFVRESGRPSISFVQRKFKIGYNRAARLIEAMEVAGAVTPVDASGMRRVVLLGGDEGGQH